MWWVWSIALNGLVATGAYETARHALRQPAGCPRLLAAATLAWTWVTVGIELLGSLGWLARGPLLAWSAAGCAIGLISRFAVVGDAPCEDRAAASATAEPGAAAERGWGLVAILTLALLIWGALWLGLQSLLLPVKVVSDGPIYHLYFAVRWWQQGRLTLIPTPFGETAAPYFPAVGDLWFTWLVSAWGGDRLARVGQAPFLLMAGAAVFASARRLGAGVTASILATAWFLTSIPLFLFSFEPNVDTIFIAGYLTACYFFLRFALGDDDLPALVLGGLAAGGALGTKAPAIVFVPVLLVLATAAVLARRREVSAGRGFTQLAAVWISPLVMAGFWYGRNAWLTGNPFYPLHLEVLGHVWLPGWYGREAMPRSQYYLPMGDVRSGCDILLAVLDPREAPFWLAALLGAGVVGGRAGGNARWVWLASGLAVLNVATYWFLIPYRTQQRFMLQALGLAAIPLAALLHRSRLLRLLALALLALHLLTPETWPFATHEREIPWDLSAKIPNAVGALISLPVRWERGRIALLPDTAPAAWGLVCVLATGSGLAAWTCTRALRRPTLARTLVATAVTVCAGAGAGCLMYPWDVAPRWIFYPSFPDYNRGWAALESLSGPAGSKVAYAGTNLPYYLMGYGLRNTVRYVNVDRHRGWLMHDYHREARQGGRPTWPSPRPGWDRIHPDEAGWLANLRAEGIEFLVVARSNPVEGPFNLADREGFPIERQWANAHPEVFSPVYGVKERDPQFRIYRLRWPADGKFPENPTDTGASLH